MEKIITTTTHKSDVEIIAENNLVINTPSMVKDFVSGLNKVKMMMKADNPTNHKQMVNWSNQFVKAYQQTNRLNRTSRLHYLHQFSTQLGIGGDELMGCVAYLPLEFQVLFARHFVSKR